MNTSLLKSALLHRQMIAALAVLNASCMALGFTTYGFIQLISDTPALHYQHDYHLVVQSVLAGTVLGIILSIMMVTAELREFSNRTLLKTDSQQLIPRKAYMLIGILAFTAMGCHSQVKVGMKRDGKTGLATSYATLEPQLVYIIMNNEVLNHHDIPLGESFVIVNEQVQGLVEKEGKVSVGCKLNISDTNGNIIFENDDLFKGNDVYNKDEISNLRCTVNTGEPMGWEEKYLVTVNFWDKYGKGKLTNKLTIKTIDLP